MRRTTTLETKLVNVQSERQATKGLRAAVLEQLKAATEKAEAIVDRMKQREAEMPYDSPIPFFNPLAEE